MNALASHSLGKKSKKHQQNLQKKGNEKEEEEHSENDKLTVPSIPGSLQTVLENLPLVYDTNNKSIQQATVNVKSIDAEEKVSFKRGHHRRSSYESAQIQLTYHPRQQSSHRNIYWTNNNKSMTAPSSFLKLSHSSTSMVRSPSSLESNNFSQSISFKNDYDMEKINDPHSDNSSLASSTTVTTSGAMATAATAAAAAGTATDSAIGESLSSKRSSLDRRSELSTGIIHDDDNDDNNNNSIVNERRGSEDDIDFANTPNISDDTDDSGKMRKRNKKSGRNALSVLSNSFTRKFFPRNKQQHISSWRIFGSKQWKTSGGSGTTSTTTSASCSSATDDICCSTTGLILEDRPSTLPAKSVAEQRRHEAQYLALIEATKRQEAQRVRQRQQLLEMKRKEEDETAAAAKVWCTRILPNWENMKDSKDCRDLWWRGIPSKVRGHVWFLAIGNELNLTPELYEICVARARQHATTVITEHRSNTSDSAAIKFEDIDKRFIPNVFPKANNDVIRHIGREGTLDLIHLDVSRTFPHLGFFQKGGPYEELLLDLLGAYVCYRPDIGYVQSMCFLGAMLLLQMHQPYQSFQAFANLLNRPLMLAFFGLRQPQMTVYFIAYDQYFEEELPKLHHHFDLLDVRPDIYLIEWIYTLYAKSLPFDVCCRVWDVFLRDGEQFLFSTALGIMHLYEAELENMNDFDAVVHFLTHLPESMSVNQLFDAIEPFVKSSSSSTTSEYGSGKKRSFQQIYSDVSERITQAAMLAGGNSKSSLFSSSMNILHPSGEPLVREKEGKSFGSLVANGIIGNSQDIDEQQAANLRSSVCNMKMSKSLSGFVDDLLRGASTRESGDQIDVIPKTRAPTAV